MRKEFLLSAADSPAQGAPNSSITPSGPVDIDELEVTVLIICKSPNNFQQTANFLTRRGWPTTVVGNLGKAIEFVVKNSPDFILISCNHPNPNTARLPSLLSQAMNSQIVGFTEQTDAASNARLMNMAFRHKLQGLASGPSLQRFIRKILIEIYNPTTPSSSDNDNTGADQQGSGGIKPPNFKSNDLRSKDAPGSSATQSGPALIKGEAAGGQGVGSSGGGILSMGNFASAGNSTTRDIEDIINGSETKGRPSQIRGIRSDLSNDPGTGARDDEDDEDEDVEEHVEGVESGSYRLSRKKDRRKLKDLTPQRNLGSSEDGSVNNRETEANRQALLALMNAERDNKVRQTEPDDKNGLVGAASSKGGLPPPPTGDAMAASKPRPGESSPNQMRDRISNDTLGGGSFMARAAARANVAVKKRPHAAPVAFRKSQPDELPLTEKQDLLVKAIEEAMTKVCDPNHLEPKKLDELNVLGVLCVDSEGLHGYLVVCAALFGPQEHILFLREFRETLLAGLMELGVQTNIEEPFSIATDTFEFRAWAETTKFTYIGEHQGSELTVSFIPTEDRLPSVKTAETRDMARIQLDLIDPEHPVSFGTYLHLKQNNKYFLYLRHGRKLMANQKSRLKEKQVQELYIKSKDISNYRAYSAASFIQRTTRRFRRRVA